jgi:PAS domain S-box-containing protein
MSTTSSRPDIQVNTLTLSFPAPLEQEYRQDYFGRYLRQTRIAMVIGGSLFALFAILDILTTPELHWTLWGIRAAVLALVLIDVVISYTPFAQHWMQPLVALSAFTANMAIVAILLISSAAVTSIHYAGSILIILATYSLLRLRFTWAVIAGWATVIGYNIAILLFGTDATSALLGGNFLFISANITGMVAAYTIEYQTRQDFSLARLLQQERANVLQARDEMEARVEERTAELKRANDILRQEMEARLRLAQKHQRLAIAVDQASEGITIFDIHGAITYVNPAMEEISGFSADELIGQSIELIHNGKQPTDVYADMWQAILEGLVWHGRTQGQRRDGSAFTTNTSITPLRDEEKHIVDFVAVHRDMTRELELEQQYLQAQKMQALGQLTGGIAHDFNNMLTAINGFAELMDMQMPHEDPMREFVQHILGSGRRAAILVRQLLAFSRKQSPERRPVDLNDVVSGLEDMLERIIGDHIKLRTDLAPELPPVSADDSQLEQVIVNLVVNARDAMPRGGAVTISTRKFTMDRQFVDANAGARRGDYVLMVVRDTGTGISASVQEHMFEPFFTTKAQGKGTGLGLATVYGIVKQYDGYVTVESEVDKGTAFNIFLPAIPTRVEEAARKVPCGEKTPFAEGAILVAEDNEPVREMVTRTLRRQGYTVIEAVDGADALKAAAAHPDPIHLLLADVVMPSIDGHQLALQLKKQRPGLRILYMSGYTDSALLPEDVMAEEADLLRKPFTPQTLLERVQKALLPAPTPEVEA